VHARAVEDAAQRAQAGASLAAAAADRARLDLLTELTSRLTELEVAASQGAILDSEILPAATQSLGLARFSYQEGETSLLDLLDAQRTYRDTQREAVEARLAQALALAEPQRLVGPTFNPRR
jgi:cobalt-zinc-cadmium efflux system outer membrane protein